MTGNATNRVIQDGLCEETFEQSSKGSEGASHVGIWQKRIPDRENAKVLRLECTQPTVEQQREQHGWRARVKGTVGKTKNLIRQGLVGH